MYLSAPFTQDAATAPGKERKYDPFARALLIGQLSCAALVQKFAIHPGGAQIFIAYFVMLAMTLAGLVCGRLEFRKSSVVALLIMVGGLTFTQLIGGNNPTLLAWLVLLQIHLGYIFSVKPGLTRPGEDLEFYQKLMVVLGLCGIVQYGLQFVIGANWAFFFELTCPQSIIIQGFHGLNPLAYGVTVYKSNGFFFLEPAIFCQFLSIAIIIELVYFKNMMRLALYLVSIAVTFSGTGMIVLFCLAPFYLLQKKQYLVLALIIMAVASAGVWAPAIGLGRIVERAMEFNNVHSSGYARFVSMFHYLSDFNFNDTNYLLFGRGAGSMPDDEGRIGVVDYAIFDPSWAKIFFEYGAVGFIFYFSFIAFVIVKSERSAYLKWACAIFFTLLGEYPTSPFAHGLILGLLVWPPKGEVIPVKQPKAAEVQT